MLPLYGSHPTHSTPRFRSTSARCQKSSSLYHALSVVVDDIDAVKGHAGHADYKYKNKPSRVRALELLISQYNLRNRDKIDGTLKPIDAGELLSAMAKRIAWPAISRDDLWKHGTQMILPQHLIEWRKYSQYSQANDGMVQYGIAPSVWSCTDVEEALHQLNLTAPLSISGPDHREINPISTYPAHMRQIDESEDGTATTAMEDIVKDVSMDDRNGLASAASRGPRLVPKSLRKRPRILYEETEKDNHPAVLHPKSTSTSDLSQTVVINTEEEVNIGKPTKMLRCLAGELNGFVKHLHQHCDLHQDLALLSDPDVPLSGWKADLQDMFNTCWGEDCMTILKRNSQLLVASDVMQSLVSAYLYRHIFQSDDVKWCKFARRTDGSVPYSMVKEILRSTFHQNGQSSSSAICSMLIDCDTTQLQYYHGVLMQNLPYHVLGSEDMRQKASIAFANGLLSTLEPLINPSKTHPDWSVRLKEPTYELIEQALNIKQSTAPHVDCAFRYLWAEHGMPVEPDLMMAKTPSGANVTVLTTLVPGLSYQKKGQPGWITLQPAEILEKVRGN